MKFTFKEDANKTGIVSMYVHGEYANGHWYSVDYNGDVEVRIRGGFMKVATTQEAQAFLESQYLLEAS